MKRRKLTLSIVTAAALAAFGAANAQTEVTANPNVGVDANVGISNTDINASADVSPGVSASQSSTDIGTSSTSGDVSASSGATSASAGAGADSSTDEERLKGLDRADQVAGAHGQQGRDNAREHQDRN